MFSGDSNKMIPQINQGLYSLSGLDAESHLPEFIILEEAKERYFRGSLLNDKKQGFIIIFWLTKNDKNQNIFYLDLFPAFNKNDNLPRRDKEGNDYKSSEYVYSPEPLGGNSGLNHHLFLNIIQNRIQKAYDDNDYKTLEIYKDVYNPQRGKIQLILEKFFGAGIFKGSKKILIHSIRNKSANLNRASVAYNDEYLLMHYFFKNDIRANLQNEYYISRTLPNDLSEKLKAACLDQLPQEIESTKRAVCYSEIMDSQEKNWQIIKNDPVKKITYLLETLCRAIEVEKELVIKDSIKYIENNLLILHPEEKNREKELIQILNKPSEFNAQSAMTAAMNSKNDSITKHFIKYLDNLSPNEILTKLIKENRCMSLDLFFLHNKLYLDKDNLSAVIDAASEGNFEIILTLLRKKGFLKETSKDNSLVKALQKGFFKALQNQNYIEAREICDIFKLEFKKIDHDQSLEKLIENLFYENIKNKRLTEIERSIKNFPNTIFQFVNKDFLHRLAEQGQAKIYKILIKNLPEQHELIQYTNQFLDTFKKSIIINSEINNFERIYEIENEFKHVHSKEIQEQKEKIILNNLNEDVELETLDKLAIFLPALFDKAINQVDSHGNTILIRAIEKNNIEMVRLLINKKINIYQHNSQNENVLIIALKNNNIYLVDLLLEKFINSKLLQSSTGLKDEIYPFLLRIFAVFQTEYILLMIKKIDEILDLDLLFQDKNLMNILVQRLMNDIKFNKEDVEENLKKLKTFSPKLFSRLKQYRNNEGESFWKLMGRENFLSLYDILNSFHFTADDFEDFNDLTNFTIRQFVLDQHYLQANVLIKKYKLEINFENEEKKELSNIIINNFFKNIEQHRFYENSNIKKYFPELCKKAVHYKDSRGFTPLRMYIDSINDPDTFNYYYFALFKDQNINIDAPEGDGLVLIKQALKDKNYNLVSYLIYIGSKIDIKKELVDAILKHIEENNIVKIKQIKRELPDFFNYFLKQKIDSINVVEKCLTTNSFQIIYSLLQGIDITQFDISEIKFRQDDIKQINTILNNVPKERDLKSNRFSAIQVLYEMKSNQFVNCFPNFLLLDSLTNGIYDTLNSSNEKIKLKREESYKKYVENPTNFIEIANNLKNNVLNILKETNTKNTWVERQIKSHITTWETELKIIGSSEIPVVNAQKMQGSADDVDINHNVIETQSAETSEKSQEFSKNQKIKPKNNSMCNKCTSRFFAFLSIKISQGHKVLQQQMSRREHPYF